MNREELIAQLRSVVLRWVAVGGRDVSEAIADFALPLLAAAREQAIEECELECESIVFDLDGTVEAQSRAMRLCQARIRALKRAPEKEHAGVAQALPSSSGNRDTPDEGARASERSVTNREDVGSSPAPSSTTTLRQRAEELLREEWPGASGQFRDCVVNAMLAFGEERYRAGQGEQEFFGPPETMRSVGFEEGWMARDKRAKADQGFSAGLRRAAQMAREEMESWSKYGWARVSLGHHADKLAALAAQQEQEKPEASNDEQSGCSPTVRQSRSDLAAPPAILSDPKILERAAEIIRRETGYNAPPARDCVGLAAELRARSAPPEPDVFEAVANEYLDAHPLYAANLAALLRARVGPVVDFARRFVGLDRGAEHALAALRGTKEEK